MKYTKKFLFKAISVFLVIISLTGCTEASTEVEFYEFAEENLATEYYAMCDELVYVTEGVDENGEFWNIESGIAEYYCNEEWYLFWPSYTMVKFCLYSEDGYNAIKQTMTDKWNLQKLADKYKINGVESTVYYVCDNADEYGMYFGFVALSDKKDSIHFFWFYNQDYDPVLNTEEQFDEFYKTEFKWFEDR